MRKFLRQIPAISLALGLLCAMTPNVQAESRYFPETAIAEWQGEQFTVQRIEFLDEDDLERQNLESWVYANRPVIEDLQSALRANSALSRALTGQSVQLNNVVAVTRALNGNLVVYLR